MRDDTIAHRLAEIEARIGAACRRAGRPRSGVTLVGASKRQPIASLEAAHAAGLRHFGENRVQEARDKRPHLDSSVHWHLLGPLQSNKVQLAVELFDTIHAIDRVKIARALERAATARGVRREGFLEVNLGGEVSKHGIAPAAAVETLLELRRELRALDLVGLMAIPPQEDDPDATRSWFRALRELRDRAREADPDFPGLLSMGMSSDFEIAIEEGASHVRVGTLLFGPRPAA